MSSTAEVRIVSSREAETRILATPEPSACTTPLWSTLASSGVPEAQVKVSWTSEPVASYPRMKSWSSKPTGSVVHTTESTVAPAGLRSANQSESSNQMVLPPE